MNQNNNNSRCNNSISFSSFVRIISLVVIAGISSPQQNDNKHGVVVEAFVGRVSSPSPAVKRRITQQERKPSPSNTRNDNLNNRRGVFVVKSIPTGSYYNDDDDDEDDDDENAMIDPDSLGDWRNFRRNLAASESSSQSSPAISNNDGSFPSITKPPSSPSSFSKANSYVLRSQNKELADEYTNNAWAHSTPTPEVGGLLVRMPIEVELFRNHKHSIMGKKLRTTRLKKTMGSSTESIDGSTSEWYDKAQRFTEDEMSSIAAEADDEGQIDATLLSEESTEMLQIYLDHQETWQEVCLVLDHHTSNDDDDQSKRKSKSTSIVLNRPMATKLTESMARLVLFGFSPSTSSMISEERRRTTPSYTNTNNDRDDDDLIKRFVKAFGKECGVYCGGPDQQENPAIVIHGHPGIEGAVELSPGCGIFRGGNPRGIVDGIADGTYRPHDFRFFLGTHSYSDDDSYDSALADDDDEGFSFNGSVMMDVSVILGKYQPIACARSIPLKQCLSLPKPLWNEVLELCGGELADISRLETMKRDELKFHVVDDYYGDYEVDDDDNDIVHGILEELDELGGKNKNFDDNNNNDNDDDDYLFQ